ncbi:MAG TPA: 50S ribosomal protein L25 [Rubrobacteraceae bacterium]|nr:50S ribosomal protein L25 [Rubrobacteraceae bacterium]
MADNVGLQANEREGRGKNDARRLRTQGFVPAVLYGDGSDATVLAVPEKIVDYTLQHVGDNALYDLSIGSGGSSTARVVDAQRNPVTGRLVHVDFAPVNMRERIVITVPLTVAGTDESPGVSEGGVLDQVAYEIEVESLPGNIPQELVVDVSGLGLNENLSLGDISLPEGVTLISDPEEVAVTVTPPTEITDEEMEAAGIVEEPSDEDAEEVEAEEETEGVSPEEGEGPAGQNFQP